MLSYLINRFIQSSVVLFAMAVIVFLGVYAIGDPAEILISPEASQIEREQIKHQMGLDLPLYQQLGRFLENAVHGDLGNSFVHGKPALELILERLPATLELVVLAMLFAVLIGVPLGVWAGLKPNTIGSRLVMSGSIFGFSLPNFWVGMLLVMFFSVYMGWLPSGGRGLTVKPFGDATWSFLTKDGFLHMLLPAMNLAIYKLSLITRLARAGTREVVMQDYIKFSRATGLPQHRIIGVYVLKNIMIPIVTVIGLEFGSAMAFAVVTETVFSWPGIGKLLLDSILQLDRPVVVAYLMFTVFLFVCINFSIDILYAALDPRIKITEKRA